MNICFLSRFSPSQHNAWSGICYQMFSHLSASHNVEWIGNRKLDFWLRALIRINRELDKVRKKRRGYSHFHRFLCIRKARNVERLLKNSNFDVIFTANSPDYIAYLNTGIPIVYVRDATFQLFINYYPTFFSLKKEQIAEGNEIERNALQKAAHIIYSSRWAAESAIRDYNADPSKISIIDFGANLLSYPAKKDLSLSVAENEVCQLLFVGVEWYRKGGDVAYKAFQKLKHEGFRCRLTIVGCQPDSVMKSDDVEIVPFLDKQNPRDFQQLYNIYLQAHFLLLPTRADCTPVVFSEAAAFALPVITTDTGGISAVIQEGINGFLLPPDADETCIAHKIRTAFEDKRFYNQLRMTSRNEFDNRLSWDVWIAKVNALLSKTAGS